MLSPMCERAIADTMQFGKALLKFISANDVGKTGSHQCGYYLPKTAWRIFTQNPPQKGLNAEEAVDVLWQDGRETASRIKWYGKETRSEYRLTRFGRDFPWLSGDNVGDLLVLIPLPESKLRGYVLDTEEDIEDIQVALGIDIVETWAMYDIESASEVDQSECIDRLFREYANELSDFPATIDFSRKTIDTLFHCIKDFQSIPGDERLLMALEEEFRLFKLVERNLCQNRINRVFRSIDDFLETAQRILQRRKARAGRSFENHVAHLLRMEDIPFSEQPEVDGRPDFILPSAEAYFDESYPDHKLIVLAIKRTCKDRWRQVTREAKRITIKHLLTVQNGISTQQIREMQELDVRLVVPKRLHKSYPREIRGELYTLDQFVANVRRTLQ